MVVKSWRLNTNVYPGALISLSLSLSLSLTLGYHCMPQPLPYRCYCKLLLLLLCSWVQLYSSVPLGH